MSSQPPYDPYNPNPNPSIPPTQYAQQPSYPQSDPYNQQPVYPQSDPYAPQGGYSPVANPYGQQQQQAGYYSAPVVDRGGGQALAGLILGIIGLVLCWFPLLGLPLSVIGIILSVIGRRSVERRVVAIIGLVLSIIALVLTLIFGLIDLVAIIAVLQSSSTQ